MSKVTLWFLTRIVVRWWCRGGWYFIFFSKNVLLCCIHKKVWGCNLSGYREAMPTHARHCVGLVVVVEWRRRRRWRRWRVMPFGKVTNKPPMCTSVPLSLSRLDSGVSHFSSCGSHLTGYFIHMTATRAAFRCVCCQLSSLWWQQMRPYNKSSSFFFFFFFYYQIIKIAMGWDGMGWNWSRFVECCYITTTMLQRTAHDAGTNDRSLSLSLHSNLFYSLEEL